ncbi:MAG: GreA/GreB family elongation factor [Verrucomicrobia bacterium]|nr:GreA/GreB family elongation factor [Verrucomicrobiota bacterium]
MAEVSTKQDINALSEWFLTQIQATPVPLDHLLGTIQGLVQQGKVSVAREWVELLRETVYTRADASALQRVLEMGASIATNPRSYRTNCRQWLGTLLADWLHTGLLDSASFESDLPPEECLRRFRVLMGLKEGAFCRDKTWGFGIVRRVDDFYKKVAIDFSRKSAHTMTFAYAAEVLHLVGPDHLLARKHNQAEDLKVLARDQADEVVRIALRSYGPLTVVQLQELISGEGIDAGDWKGFWDRARKALKKDDLVEVPTKRSEPLRILETRRAYDDAWYATFQKERDPKTILELVVELEKSGTSGDASAASRTTLGERLAFAIRGAEDRTPELAARLLMAADRLGLGDTGVDMVGAASTLATSDRLLTCMGLPARDVDGFLKLLERLLPDASARLILLLPRLPVHAAHVVIDALRALGKAEPVAAMVRADLASRSVSAEVLDYLCEHHALITEWNLGSLSDMLQQIVNALEVPGSGQRYHTQKALRERFESRAWLEAVLSKLHARERSQLLARIRQSRGWDESSRRSLMGRLIKLFPDLEVIVARAEKTDEAKTGHLTSWRSYRERQEQLRIIVEVSIPENSKEIGHARSYGDLRENFEYQAAKDAQRLLMRRQAELERDLNEIHGTDFAGITVDCAGIGTGVKLQRPNGDVELYWILGEWDRDAALNIISNKSAVALRLEGATPGTELAVPGDAEGKLSRVLEVLPLIDAVRAWARGAVPA